MKLECQRDKLRQAVGLAERVTGKNLSLPVLGSILLSANGHTLVVRATNLDLGVEWRLPAKVSTPGEVLVSGAVLHNFLSSLTGVDKLTLEVVNNNLTVATGNSSTLVKTQSVDDFPTLPEVEGASEFALSPLEFQRIVKATSYAAALNDIKPEIASLYLYSDGDVGYAVATDSFRLAEKRFDLAAKPKEAPKLIIPIRNVAEISRLLETQNDLLSWRYNRNQLTIVSDQLTVTSRLIDGVFPDYRQIMPTKHASLVTVEANVLSNALKLAQIFTDRLNHVTLKLRPDDNLVEITSQNGEVGENTSLLPASVSGEELTINLNLRYLLDGLQAQSDPQITLQFNGRNKPILLSGTTDSSFRYLIMPLNR
jgi:DNA polymerase-3 subunit beta